MLSIVKTTVLSAGNVEEIAISSKHFSLLMHFIVGIYICWAQSMDSDNPRIALLKAWIHALRGQSTDRPLHNPRIVPTGNIACTCQHNCTIPGLHMRCVRRPTWRAISRTRASEVRDRHDTQGQERGRCLPWLTERASKTTSSATL